jgi:transcription elongation factor Elf1
MQEATIPCPHCNHANVQRLTTTVDLAEHPKQKLAILTDSLFTVSCAHCQKQYSIEHELMVHDKKNRYALLLTLQDNLFELDASVSGIEATEFDTLRLVGSNAQLKEKILLFDAGLNDQVIELCKLYLLMQSQQHQLLFAEHQTAENKLIFSALDEKGALQCSVACDYGLYAQLEKTVHTFSLTPHHFVLVDQSYAYEQIRNNAGL